MWFLGRKAKRSHKWEYLGNNRNTGSIPGGVLSTFAKMPGSHGTRPIDYPFVRDGESIHLKGRTYRYRIDLGDQKWQVYRRPRRSSKRTKSD